MRNIVGSRKTTVDFEAILREGPIKAIVTAFGYDERTVSKWQVKGGQHCQQVHEHIVGNGQVELGHVQADELRVKMVGKHGRWEGAISLDGRLRKRFYGKTRKEVQEQLTSVPKAKQEGLLATGPTQTIALSTWPTGLSIR